MTLDTQLFYALLYCNRVSEEARARTRPHTGFRPTERTNTVTVSLRPYTQADLDACMDIWRRASEQAHAFLGTAELDADAVLVRTLYMPGAEIIVAEANGRVAGFVALVGAFVGGLFVDPARHRRGIGRRLMAAAERRRGPLTLEVYVENRGARDFYSDLGYREILCQINDDQGRPHPLVRMTRVVDDARALLGRVHRASEPGAFCNAA